MVLDAHSQQFVKGRVLDTSGKPLQNATVKVPEDNKTTFTDSLGNFQIQISSPKNHLKITYTGYTAFSLKLEHDQSKELTIFLTPGNYLLKEINVSTGYQKIDKTRATGSFGQIDQELINEQATTHILDRLETIAPSLIVDRTTSGNTGRLMIRGLSTIQGPKDPLIILDNFPYEGNPDNINPNDIENITMLKDAAAASIWGTRAGNGVIVITTKKGRYNHGLSIDFNANTTLGNKPDLSYAKPMTSLDFIDVETYLFNQGYNDSQIGAVNQPALSPVVELLIKKKTANSREDLTIDQQIERLKTIDVRDDFRKYIYGNSVNQQYSVGLKGGTEKMNWHLSSGYDNNKSQLNERYQRTSLRFQNNFRPLRNLELYTTLAYTAAKNTSGKLGYGNITSAHNALYPYAVFADQDGNRVSIPKDWRQSYIRTAGDGKLLSWEYYPLADFNFNNNAETTKDLIINTGLIYKFPLGFTAEVKYQYQHQTTSGRDLHDDQSYFARNLINGFTQINGNGEVVYKVPPGGILDQSDTENSSANIRGQLNYLKDLGKHNLTVFVGAELREIKNTGNYNRIYGYNQDILTSGNVDYTNPYPDFITGYTSFIPSRQGISETLNRFVSMYGNAGYTFDQKYILSVSGRRDASNLFGLSTNDKWKPLWSAGLAWILTNESFINIPQVSYLKLRATYGFSGNVDQSKSAVTTIQYFSALSQNTLTPFATFNKFANPELKWESSRMINIGLDFQGIANRVTGSIEYYTKKGTDLFGTSPLDYTAGIGSFIVKNVASMKSDGWDLVLNTQNIKGNFSWNTNLNFSAVKDKVTEYYLNNTQASYFLNKSNTISGVTGKPVYAVFAYKWAGLDGQSGLPMGYLNGEQSNDYQEITGQGTQINDLAYSGSAIPTVFGSMGNTFAYKNLSVTIRLTYKLGYYFRRESINYPNLFSGWEGNSDYAQRWRQPGDEATTNVPAFVYPFTTAMQSLYTFSEPLIERADHIRLNYIQFNYDLNKNTKKWLPFKTCSLYANMTNLGLLWRANKQNLDPDFVSGFSIPQPKTYTLGLRANL
jgi:TonB-linked SusC/RagA family outer membrane protein